METLFMLYQFIILITIIFTSSKSQSGETSSESDNTTPLPTTTSATSATSTAEPDSTISTDALCGCFDLDIVCEPTLNENTTCYVYELNRISNEPYCMEINYLILGVGDQCELPTDNINDLVVNYAPNCYDIEIDDGIKVIFDENNSQSSSSSSSESSDSSSSDTASQTTIIISDDYMVFSICFDSNVVDGTQETGQIEVSLGFNSDSSSLSSSSSSSESESSSSSSSNTNNSNSQPTTTTSGSSFDSSSASNIFTCDVPNILPNFCVGNQTTIEAIDSVCSSDDALNVAFLLDESNSVNETEWSIMKQFVGRIINNDVSPQSFVALWEYSRINVNNFMKFLDFTNANSGRTSTPNTFVDALDTNPFNIAGITETWEAVNRILDDFWDYRFECADGCDTRGDILFVITDGAPTDDPCPRIVPRLNGSDVDIVLIIVGGGGNGKVDWEDEVSCLDVKSNYTDIFLVPEFNSEDFNEIEASVREKLCSGNNPAGPSNRPENGTQWRYNGTIGLGPIPEGDGDCAPNCGTGDA